MRHHFSVALALWAIASGSSTRERRAQQRSEASRALAGKSIRVSFTNVENPLIFRGSAGEWTGVLVDFFSELRKEAGFVVNVTEVSDDSIAVVGSNLNTACPRDISKNRTDLCVGNAWVTTERLGYAFVSPTFWQEKIELAVRLGKSSFSTRLLQAFKPFSLGLWLTMAVVIILHAAFTWYLEHEENNRDFPEKGVASSGAASLYFVLVGFVWSDPATRPVTAEGRILDMGFGLFLVLMLLSYTASLASVLVSSNRNPELADLPDAIRSNAKVCMRFSMLDRAERVYDGLRPAALEIDSWDDGYNKLSQGVCDGLLIDRTFHARAQEDKPDRDCDKVLVGEPAVGINCGWFVAGWLAGPLSYFMTALMDKGVLDDLRRVYFPKGVCPQDLSDEEVVGLRAESVGGVFFTAAAFLSLAAAVHCFKRCRRSGCLSAGSSGSKNPKVSLASRDLEDPAFALVRAFREESGLRGMPFEKSLLAMGQARLEANAELMRKLLELKARRQGAHVDKSAVRSVWASVVGLY